MAEKASVVGTGRRCAESHVTLHQVLLLPLHTWFGPSWKRAVSPKSYFLNPGSVPSTLESTKQGYSCGIVLGHLPEKTLSQKQAWLHLTD